MLRWRVRWLPMTLIFLVFLQMVLCPSSSCWETQRATQAWWRRQGRRLLNPNTNAFCQARARLPLAWLQKVWWRLADRICAQARSLLGCHGRRMNQRANAGHHPQSGAMATGRFAVTRMRLPAGPSGGPFLPGSMRECVIMNIIPYQNRGHRLKLSISPPLQWVSIISCLQQNQKLSPLDILARRTAVRLRSSLSAHGSKASAPSACRPPPLTLRAGPDHTPPTNHLESNHTQSTAIIATLHKIDS